MKILRTICITVFIVIMTGLFSLCVSAENVEKDFENDVIKYNALDITDIDLVTSGIKPDTLVTRSAFADIAARIIYSDFEMVSDAPIGDLSEDDKGMMYLRSLGIINGNGDGLYEPDREIKVSEAMRIFVAIAGYSVAAELEGGLLNDYMSVALDLGILKNTSISIDDAITYENLFDMLDNVTEIEVLEKSYNGSTFKKGISLLEKYKQTLRAKGVVEASGDSSIYSYDDVYEGYVIINGEEFNADGLECEQYVGMNTEFYYSVNDYELVIKYIAPYKNEIITLNHNDIDSFDAGVYTYYENNSKKKTARISDDTIYMYNGKRAEKLDSFIPACGWITFIDNDSDGSYEVLRMTNKEITVVSSVIVSDMKIIDEFNSRYSLNLSSDKCEGYEIYNADGKRIDLQDIASGNILEVEKSNSTMPIIKITVLNSEIQGEIESIDSDGEVKIGTEIYKQSARFKEILSAGEMSKSFAVGEECIAYLNSLGELVYVAEKTYSDYRLGFVLKSFLSDDGDDVYIRIYDEGGTTEVLGFYSRVKVDSGYIKSKKITIDTFETYSIVKYKTNINGDITEIYYPSDNSEHFRIVSDGEWEYRKTILGGLFAKVENGTVVGSGIDQNAKIFYIPSDYKNKRGTDGYAVLSPDKLSVWNKYNIIGCNTEGEYGKADVLVWYASSKYGFSDNAGREPALVNKIHTKLCDDDEVRKVIEVLMSGSSITVEIEDERSDSGSTLPFERGDVIYFSRTGEGRLMLNDAASNYEILIKRNGDDIVLDEAGYKFSKGNYNQDGVVRYGAVYDTGKNFLMMNSLNDISNDKAIEYIDLSSSAVRTYIYDEELKKYRSGNIEEAIGYKHDTSEYSMVYTFVNYNYAVVIIYP